MTGNESEFVKALSYNPINKSTVEELKQVLKLVMLKVGLRAQNLPTDLEKQVLIEHISNEYGRHTPMEIKLAFDMAIAGKLDLEDKEVVCYENFSCLYFSKIMNAYRVWAKDTHAQLKTAPMQLEESKEITDEDMVEWIMDWKNKEQITLDLIPLVFYDFLVNKKSIIVISNKEKWEYAARAATAIKVQLAGEMEVCKTTDAYKALAEFTQQEVNGFTGVFRTRIENKAKRLIVFDYLKPKVAETP